MEMQTVWFWKGPLIAEGYCRANAYSSDEYTKPSTVISDVEPTDSSLVYSLNATNDGRVFITTYGEQYSCVPELWFIAEYVNIHTEMFYIHAMSCKTFPIGTIVDAHLIDKSTVDAANRVGLISWFKCDSRMHQILVSPEWRRKRISTMLIAAADIYIVSKNLGPYLTGGDITTADGEKLRAAWANSTRVIKRSGEAIIPSDA